MTKLSPNTRAILTMTILGVASIAHANSYQIVDLGLGYIPVSVNRVQAVAANKTSPRVRGETYRNGEWRNLTPHSQVVAINREGSVAGADYFSGKAMMWPHNGTPIVIEMPNGVMQGAAADLNNAGTVVGAYFMSGLSHCYEWNSNSGSADLGLMGAGSDCSSAGINSNGQITGSASADASGADHAFIWSQGVFTDLGIPLDGNYATGIAINDSGSIVGQTYYSGGVSKAFLWNGKLVDLDPEAKFESTTAASISNRGEIVGWAQKEAGSNSVAVRFTQTQRIVTLSDEVLNLEDWKLKTANSVNDKGVIVGLGFHTKDGLSHGYMLIPQ